jgi:hypothetical protein
MRKRGLVWKREPQAKPISDEEILIRLREYPERNSADVDQDSLARVGIKAFLFEDVSVEQAGEHLDSNRTQLLVRARDLAAARQQLMEKDEMEAVIAQETQEAAPPSKLSLRRQPRQAGLVHFQRDRWREARGGTEYGRGGRQNSFRSHGRQSRRRRARVEQPFFRSFLRPFNTRDEIHPSLRRQEVVVV